MVKKKIIFRAWRKFILIIKVLLMAAESQKLSHSKKIKQRGRKLANICAKLVWRLYTTSCVLCLILLVVYLYTILQFLLSFAAFSLFINKKRTKCGCWSAWPSPYPPSLWSWVKGQHVLVQMASLCLTGQSLKNAKSVCLLIN